MINIVYDVDDVLNNLNEYVFLTLGLSFPKLYEISKCTEYTEEQKDSIIHMYKDPNTFRNLQYYSEASNICKVEALKDAAVWINSNNLTQEIAEIKTRSLIDRIPMLNSERIVMQIIELDKHKTIKVDKKPITKADIIVEDNLLSLLKYGTRASKILIDKTYNKAEAYGFTDRQLGMIRVGNLREANECVKGLVEGQYNK